MAVFLVDSNVILDFMSEDPVWSEWSINALRQAADSGRTVINPIIYAEISTRFSRIETLDEVLAATLFEREDIPYEAAFLAGKCYVEYRRRGGVRTSTLPDFFIGAHAAVAGYTLLTRDAARYHTYFPGLEIISP